MANTITGDIKPVEAVAPAAAAGPGGWRGGDIKGEDPAAGYTTVARGVGEEEGGRLRPRLSPAVLMIVYKMRAAIERTTEFHATASRVNNLAASRLRRVRECVRTENRL